MTEQVQIRLNIELVLQQVRGHHDNKHHIKKGERQQNGKGLQDKMGNEEQEENVLEGILPVKDVYYIVNDIKGN